MSGWMVLFVFLVFSITSLVGVLKLRPFIQPAPIWEKAQKEGLYPSFIPYPVSFILYPRFPAQSGIHAWVLIFKSSFAIPGC